MVDFAVLPPEVTSGRMYAGSGSGPLVAAAAAWDRLAATLGSAAESYRSVVTDLTDESWQGPASASMTAAAQPQVDWMNTTAVQAAAMATQARAAAAAYETAHAAVVPPPVIEANRAALSTLIAGNVLGQNTAAIAANQAEYGAMWAHDAAVMQTYAAGSAAAIKPLEAFSPAPQTTNPAGAAASSTAAGSGLEQVLTALLNFLTNSPLNTGPLMDVLTSPLVSGFNEFSSKISGILGFIGGQGFMVAGVGVGGFDLPIQGAIASSYLFAALNPASVGLASSVSGGGTEATLAGAYVPPAAISGVPTPGVPGMSTSDVSASLGRAATVGRLSAPTSWIAAAPQEVRLAGASLSMPGLSSAAPAGIVGSGGMAGMAGVPIIGSMVNTANNGGSGAQSRSGANKPAPAAAAVGGGVGAAAVSPQRDELNRLRKSVVEMTMQRDALKRQAASVIRRVKKR